MAAREVGLTHVPAVVSDLSDEAAARLAVNLNTVHGGPTAELMAPFLAGLSDDVLAHVHLEGKLLQDTLDFDKQLAERLAELQIPDLLDQASGTRSLPGQGEECPTCGHRTKKKKR
jgi:ParB-like chromosome segregation protein Spo0J